jgi:cobyrinic acid a,c-diamide synthase
VPAAERAAEAVATVDRLGALVTRSCDLEALVRLARSAPPLTGTAWDPAVAIGEVTGAVTGEATGDVTGAVTGGMTGDVPGGVTGRAAVRGPERAVVAVAGGAAFTFGYAEHVELLRAAGAEVAVFDPLRDEALPAGTGAVVIGGGFPEMYAAELSANKPLRGQVAAFDGPIAAECAGLLYLCRELDGQRMCGRVPGVARMSDRLTLGYRDAVAVRRSLLTEPGERFSGHEFHRTVIEIDRTAVEAVGEPVFRWAGGADGFGDPLLTASYLHLHWAGRPAPAQRLVSSSRSPSVLR